MKTIWAVQFEEVFDDGDDVGTDTLNVLAGDDGLDAFEAVKRDRIGRVAECEYEGVKFKSKVVSLRLVGLSVVTVFDLTAGRRRK